MGHLCNTIVAILILVIISAISSTDFYKQGQKDGWQKSQTLIPLEKGEIYLCVEKTDDRGVRFLSVQEISAAAKDKTIDQRELRFRLNLALNGMSLQEYNEKFRGGKKEF